MINRNMRQFAPIGLVISGLAALVSFGLYIIQRSFNLPMQISLGLIVIGLAAAILLDPQKALALLTGRQARHGSNSFLMTVAVVGILVVINYLVSNNSKQWDLTEDRQNTLTSETQQALVSLKTPVNAEAFYSNQLSISEAQKLLQNFESNSKGKFTFEFINPVTDPIRAQQANITKDGTIVLIMEDRQEQITFASEEMLTGALIRLANPGERVVYFLTGHGEFEIDGASDSNYSQVSDTLKAKNYTVSQLNLVATPSIPDDALAIIVAGPQKPLTEQEISLIKSYQEKGGALVYLAEPRITSQFGDQIDPMVSYLDTVWGIGLDDDIIIDFSADNTQPFNVVSNRFASHAITQQMNSLALVLPSARSVRLNNQLDNIQVTELAQTTENAWGETDFTALQKNQAAPDPANDRIGPVPFAVAGENSTNSSRIVVVGDSDFAGSGAYDQLGNSDFILNAIDWAAQQDNLISLTPREPIQRFMLPLTGTTLNMVLFGSVFLLPGLVIFTGVYVWLQRRRKG
jgi:ABC-type uncharacterized transport system involved in gliding motility auxiliary subunit